MRYTLLLPGDFDLPLTAPLDPDLRWYYVVAGAIAGRSVRGAYRNHALAFRAAGRIDLRLLPRVLIIRSLVPYQVTDE